MPGWKKGDLSGKAAQFILCPLFCAHSERKILCEGHIPNTRTEQQFKTKGEKTQQQTIFCEGCYKKCEHYISVMHFRWNEDE